MKKIAENLFSGTGELVIPKYNKGYRDEKFGDFNSKTFNLVGRHILTTGLFAGAVTTTVLWTKNIQNWRNIEELPKGYEELSQAQKTAYDNSRYDSFGGDHHKEYYNFFADMPNGKYGELYNKISTEHPAEEDDSQKMLDYLITEVSKEGKTKLGTSIKATIEETQTDILTNKVSNFNDFNKLFDKKSDYYIAVGESGVVTEDNYDKSFLTYYTSKAPLTAKPAVNSEGGTDKTKIDYQKHAEGTAVGATDEQKKALQHEVTRIHDANCPYINSYQTAKAYSPTDNLEKLTKDSNKIDYDIWYAGTPRTAKHAAGLHTPTAEQKKALLHEISRVHNKSHPENPIYFNREDVDINKITPQMQETFYKGLNAKFDVSTTMLDAMGKAGFTSLLVFQWVFFLVAAISSGHAQVNRNPKSTTLGNVSDSAGVVGSSVAGQADNAIGKKNDAVEEKSVAVNAVKAVASNRVDAEVDGELARKQQAILGLYKDVSNAKIDLLSGFIYKYKDSKKQEQHIIPQAQYDQAISYIDRELERIKNADINLIDYEITNPVPVKKTTDGKYNESILELFVLDFGGRDGEASKILNAILEANKFNRILAIVKQEIDGIAPDKDLKDSVGAPELDEIAQPFRDYQSTHSSSPRPVKADQLINKLKSFKSLIRSGIE